MPTDSKRPLEDSGAAQKRFLSLFLRSEREIFHYVAALVPNVTEAEDIVQQTAMALWEKFDAYDPAQPFTPWACRFALNKAREGGWLHLAVVVDGRNRQVVHYLNGDPVSRHALKLDPPFRVGAAELGNWYAGSGSATTPVLIRNLSGSFDEFGLFSRALSDAEVRALYATGKPNA